MPETKKIQIDTETKTIYVDENMTPEEFEAELLGIAFEKGIDISIQDSDPQLIEKIIETSEPEEDEEE